MSGMFETLKVLLMCGTLVTIAFVVLLAMPKSELRKVLMPIIGWAMAIFCGIYAISPIDVVPEAAFGPFGLIDDVGAVVVGVAAAKAAMRAGDE